MNLPELKAAIRKERISKGYSQVKLAKLSDVPRSRIAKLEDIESPEGVNMTTFLAIMDALDMKLQMTPANGGRPVYDDILEEKDPYQASGKEDEHVPGLG